MPRFALSALVCLALAPAPGVASEGHGHDGEVAHKAEHGHGEELGHDDAHGHAEEHAGEEEHAHEDEHGHGEEAHAEDNSEHVSEAAWVRIVHGWTRATTGDEALVFAEIENTSGGEITLTGASTAIAEDAVLVGFQMKDGELGYVPLPGVPLSSGREMKLAPNGLAIRLEGLDQPLEEGHTVDVTLSFDAGEVEVHVAVEDSDASQHSHAGHQH